MHEKKSSDICPRTWSKVKFLIMYDGIKLTYGDLSLSFFLRVYKWIEWNDPKGMEYI